MEKEDLLALGRIEGKLDMLLQRMDQQDVAMKDMDRRWTERADRQDSRMDGLDNRMRGVEQKAAKYGAVTSVGVALAIEFMKRAM